MIDKIKLKFGSSASAPGLEINITPITVFVGPNNSGKSKILIEIEKFCSSLSVNSSDLLIENIDLKSYSEEQMIKEISQIEQTPKAGENVSIGNIIIGKVSAKDNTAVRITIVKDTLINEAKKPNELRYSQFFHRFLDMYTLRLDGTNRLNLLHIQQAGDLLATPANHLAHLFSNNELRKEVRRIVYEAFGKYYVIDPTNMGHLRVKLSDREPVDESEEKGWDQKSVNFHKDGIAIENASDGVKAFCGIITTLLAGDPKITLIDEPEAFLHPALSNKLGKEIGKSLGGSNKRLLVSTHSSNFLMGAIQSGAPMNIVRLTYKNSVATARILPEDKILHLMRHPLLRSTGVLNGLFFEAVIVCEADSDRAFYQEINERLLSESDNRGINNCLFINAQNKQTVWEIIKPLRELGIPTIALVDIDVVKEGGQVFSKVLDGAFIPLLNHQPLQSQRLAIFKAFTATGKDMKKGGGVDVLVGTDKEACNNFLDQLNEYGMFVVRNGELESWLKVLKSSGHGPSWLIETFTKMGENPNDANYLKPSQDDVWNFIGEIKLWLDNPKRKGIPE